MLAFLRDRGVSDEQLARVHAPAGLDLGSVATDEIGVAVLADLVRLRAEEGLGAVAIPAPSPETHEALDPICGMTVQVASARYRSIYEGQTYYFCSAGCLQKFEESPADVRDRRLKGRAVGLHRDPGAYWSRNTPRRCSRASSTFACSSDRSRTVQTPSVVSHRACMTW